MTAMIAPARLVRDLVLDSTEGLKPAVSVLDADVSEIVDSDENPALLIKMRVVHQASPEDWKRSRARMIQKIRDELLRSGDERYPFVTTMTDEEWEQRDR